jgi:hypothetical protein
LEPEPARIEVEMMALARDNLRIIAGGGLANIVYVDETGFGPDSINIKKIRQYAPQSTLCSISLNFREIIGLTIVPAFRRQESRLVMRIVILS